MLIQADGFQLLSCWKLSHAETLGVVVLFPDDQVADDAHDLVPFSGCDAAAILSEHDAVRFGKQ